MITYTFITKADADALSAFYAENLNDGPDLMAWLANALELPDYIGVKAMNGDRLVGAVTVRPGVDFTCNHQDLEEGIENMFPKGDVSTFDMWLVDPNYRGLGISRRMAKLLKARLREVGVRHILAEQWVHPGERGSEITPHLALIGDVHKLMTIPHFYRNLSECGMTCPICGENCQCGAVISIVYVD
jgi:GNAT superfamily N-acetyltransferase